MSSWDLYASWFDAGIPGGEYISTIFIIGLCTLGLLVARRMYKDL